jgi:hypothetical protein
MTAVVVQAARVTGNAAAAAAAAAANWGVDDRIGRLLQVASSAANRRRGGAKDASSRCPIPSAKRQWAAARFLSEAPCLVGSIGGG